MKRYDWRINEDGDEEGRVIVKLPDNRLSDKEVESTGLICGGAVQAIARELLQSRRKLHVINSRIETLIGVACPRCEKGDPLFVEPDTGFYTHSLGGNYCDAHKLHSLLDTEASRRARNQETSVCMCGHPRYLHERRNTPQELEDCRAKLCNCTHFTKGE